MSDEVLWRKNAILLKRLFFEKVFFALKNDGSFRSGTTVVD